MFVTEEQTVMALCLVLTVILVIGMSLRGYSVSTKRWEIAAGNSLILVWIGSWVMYTRGYSVDFNITLSVGIFVCSLCLLTRRWR